MFRSLKIDPEGPMDTKLLSLWTKPLHFQNDFKRLYKPYKEKPNLSKMEVKALTELMNNKHIVIKPADKGSAVVVLGRDQYIKEVYRQLNNNTYYKKLSEPIYLQTVPMVQDILDRLQKDKFITGKQKTYLKGETQPRPRGFYILPKIHKEPNT